jgi:glycosyltransferase involved in cell wall biosynthesis
LTDTPIVSVIIPTYNRASTVCSAVESVLTQTYSPFEIIVVDDGSTDDTRARLQRFGGQVRVIFQQNSGPASARNAGVKASRGKIIAFLDSDDQWLPCKMTRQVEVLEEAGGKVGCCISNMTLCFNDGRRGTSFDSAGISSEYSAGIWLNPAEVLATRFLMFNQAVAIRRAAFEEVGGFDERLTVLEDYDLALRLSIRGPWAFVRKPLVEWRQSEDSLSHVFKESSVSWEAWGRILGDFVAGMPSSPAYARIRSSAVAASKKSRRELRARRLSESSSTLRRIAGRSYLKSQRAWAAVFRHSPWYPNMETVTLDEYQSTGQLLNNEPRPALAAHEAARDIAHGQQMRPRSRREGLFTLK